MSKHPRQGVSGASPADLGWMSGSWKGQYGQDQVEEHWSFFGAGTLMGMLRWQKEGGVFFYEFLTIERQDDHVLLRIKHFDPGLKGWEEKDTAMECLLVEVGDREAVFLEVNDPGRWVVYRLETDDRLVSYFETDDGPACPEGIFVYSRQEHDRPQS